MSLPPRAPRRRRSAPAHPPWRPALIAALLALALATSGCWSRREIESIAFVLSTGLDVARSEEENVRVSVAIARPLDFGGAQGEGASSPQPWVADATGKTVFEAIRSMRSTSPRILFWGHNSLLVIGEELAREGIAPYLDFFTRDVEPRLTTWVMVAKETTANDILNARFGLTPVPLNLVQTRSGASEWVLIDLNHFLQRLQDEGIEPIATRVERQRAGAEVPVPPEQMASPDAASEPMGLRTIGAAIFKDDRLVGWFNGTEARGYSWVTGETQGGVLVLPSCPDGSELPTTIELVERPRTLIDVTIEGGRPAVSIHVIHESVLGETACPIELTSATIQSFERRLSESVENEILAAIDRAKLLGSDVFGFGQMFRRKHNRVWNEQLREHWDTLFRELEVTVHVTSFIRKSGLTATRFPVR